jgi:hypothetical protein
LLPLCRSDFADVKVRIFKINIRLWLMKEKITAEKHRWTPEAGKSKGPDSSLALQKL